MNLTFENLQSHIEAHYESEQPAQWQSNDLLMEAVHAAIEGLNSGCFKVVERQENGYVVHTWLKKAILMYLKTQPCQVVGQDHIRAFDKVPLKYAQYDQAMFEDQEVRVVPSALVRYGAFIEKGAVLMPSYVNIGAYVGEGAMIDTWATVGSCAHIGRHVHLSGGAGIGGVLEPLQALPTIIEDHCFIGARSEIVEGVVVEEGAVIGMGVMLSQSTKIYDRTTGKVSYGRVPKNAVVVPGSLPSASGHCHLNCAVIVKYADLATRAKTGINALLRDEV
mgnify:CR=1 FL=1